MKCQKCKKFPAIAWLEGKFICKDCFERGRWELGVIRRQRKMLERKEERGKE